jgi:hypothetical protein
MPSLIEKRIECPVEKCRKLLCKGHVGSGIIYVKCRGCRNMIEIKNDAVRVVKK